jgi:hypothetical protein
MMDSREEKKRRRKWKRVLRLRVKKKKKSQKKRGGLGFPLEGKTSNWDQTVRQKAKLALKSRTAMRPPEGQPAERSRIYRVQYGTTSLLDSRGERKPRLPCIEVRRRGLQYRVRLLTT